MNKEVLISIRGLQYQGPGNEQGSAEAILAGRYYLKDGARYLIYDEPEEDFDKGAHTMIKITDDRVELSRKGPVTVSMNFLKGQKNLCSYKTPFGSLMVGIDTTDIRLDTPDDDTLKLEIFYNLDINYSFYAECHMELEVRSKETAGPLFSEKM